MLTFSSGRPCTIKQWNALLHYLRAGHPSAHADISPMGARVHKKKLMQPMSFHTSHQS